MSSSVFKSLGVARHLSKQHDKYAVVLADKAPNKIVFVGKSHVIGCLLKELFVDNSFGNPIYVPMTLNKEKIPNNHRPFLSSLKILTKQEE